MSVSAYLCMDNDKYSISFIIFAPEFKTQIVWIVHLLVEKMNLLSWMRP